MEDFSDSFIHFRDQETAAPQRYLSRWPPYASDLTPYNCFLWGQLKDTFSEQANKHGFLQVLEQFFCARGTLFAFTLWPKKTTQNSYSSLQVDRLHTKVCLNSITTLLTQHYTINWQRFLALEIFDCLVIEHKADDDWVT